MQFVIVAFLASRPGSLLRGLLLLAGLAACVPASAGTPQSGEPILAMPPAPQLDSRRVALGDRLFHDPRLSADNSVSCASCHPLAFGGADGQRYSRGIQGRRGSVNTPTVFNSSLNFTQFWDGRSATLNEQVEGPLHNPAEMGSSWRQVIARLGQDRALVAAFREIYPEGLSAAAIRDAIVTFERSLVTVDAPFDRYLKGDRKALSPQALQGYRWFKAYGCAACHQGVAVGGNMYQQMGAMGDYFQDRGQLTRADLGRFNITGDEADRQVFKVPSLRLVALTAPYFHDGSARNLDEAIAVMARYQLGRQIAPAQRRDIAAFLASLAGRHPRLAANR